MLTDELFWNWIEKAKRENSILGLENQLLNASNEALLYYECTMRKKIQKLFVPDILNLIRLLYGYPAFDYFIRFTGWIIWQGRDVYNEVCSNPESIARYIDNGKYDFSFEEITSIPDDVYYQKLKSFTPEIDVLDYDYLYPSTFGILIFDYDNLNYDEVRDFLIKDTEQLKAKYPKIRSRLERIEI